MGLIRSIKFRDVILAGLFSLCIGCSSLEGPRHPSSLDMPDVEFAPVEPLSWQLENGLTVFFESDAEVPLVQGTLYLPGGQVFDPPGLEGLAGATGDQIRDGGIVGIAPQILDEQLDALGAEVSSSFGQDYGTISFSCLASDLEKVMGIFSEIVQRPGFDRSRFELWKSKYRQEIVRRREDPELMASMIFNSAIYGEQSPYSKVSSLESVDRIGIDNMYDFHKRFVRPNKAVLALSGDIPEDEAKQMVLRFFGDWQRAQGVDKLPAVDPAVSKSAKGVVYVLERDFKQASLVVGHLGTPRVFGEMYDISAFSRIFGLGGMQSMLFNELRTRQGLAYSVYGGFFPESPRGIFAVYLGTSAGKVPVAIEGVSDLIRQVTSEPQTEDTVEQALHAVEQSFVFRFDEEQKRVERSALLKILGYPAGFDAAYLKNMLAVTPRSIGNALNLWLHPQDLVIVVVGDISADSLRSALGDRFVVKSVGFEHEPKLEN